MCVKYFVVNTFRENFKCSDKKRYPYIRGSFTINYASLYYSCDCAWCRKEVSLFQRYYTLHASLCPDWKGCLHFICMFRPKVMSSLTTCIFVTWILWYFWQRVGVGVVSWESGCGLLVDWWYVHFLSPWLGMGILCVCVCVWVTLFVCLSWVFRLSLISCMVQWAASLCVCLFSWCCCVGGSLTVSVVT